MKNIIMQRTNCTDNQAEKLEKKLSNISPRLQPILQNWLDNGIESNEEEFYGYSIDSLMKHSGLSFTGALLTIDWLLREPELATQAIQKGIK